MNEEKGKMTKSLLSVIFGGAGIASMIVEFGGYGLVSFQNVLQDSVVSLVWGLLGFLPIVCAVTGLILALCTDKEEKYRKVGLILNIVLLSLSLIIPLIVFLIVALFITFAIGSIV